MRLDRRAQRVLVGGVAEVDVLGLGRAPDQVVVRILEARQHQRARQIVDLGALEERRDVVRPADRRDAAVDQGDRAGLRLAVVHRQDAGAAQHQRLAVGKRRRRPGEESERRGEKQSGLSSIADIAFVLRIFDLKLLVVQFQHSHPTDTAPQASVRIEGPLASI